MSDAAALSLREYYPQTLGSDRQTLQSFLAAHGLDYEGDIEYGCGLTQPDGTLVCCGCCAGGILKCFAVSQEYRGENLLGRLLSVLMANRFQAGHYRLFVYTKPENTALFTASGFSLLAQTDQVAMLENWEQGVKGFLSGVKEADAAGEIGSVVMNCNPFTLGHLHLVEYAASQCDWLYLFVVEEDRSVFPFPRRLELVREGVGHLKNVRVGGSGPYMISNSTFPTYFLKEKTDVAQAQLDLTVFAQKIAPALGITVRFVGQEPYCAATQGYNQMMNQLLPAQGIKVVEIARKQDHGGAWISATKVRQMLAQCGPGEWLLDYVPPNVSEFLCSVEARPILEKLRDAGQSW